MALPLMVFEDVDGPFMDALGMVGLMPLGRNNFRKHLENQRKHQKAFFDSDSY